MKGYNLVVLFLMVLLGGAFLAGTVAPVIVDGDPQEAAAAAAPQLLDPPPMRSATWPASDAELYCLSCAPFLNHDICWPTESCAPGMPTLTLTAEEMAWVTATFEQFATVQEFLRKKTWQRRRAKVPRVKRDARRDRWRGWALPDRYGEAPQIVLPPGQAREPVPGFDGFITRTYPGAFRVVVVRESATRRAGRAS